MKVLIAPTESSVQSDLKLVLDFDNSFRLTPYVGLLRQAEAVVLQDVNVNRFYERTIKETLAYVAVGQGAAFLLRDNDHLTWFGLKNVVEKLYPAQFAVKQQSTPAPGVYWISFVRHTPPPEHHTAPHTGWTFGILTLGNREGAVRVFLESIRQYVSGPYEIVAIAPRSLSYLSGDERTRQITFSERDDVGWITRKKNLICEQAAYSDILICHDRFTLSPGFSADFDRWGYNYCLATPRVHVRSRQCRGLDWAVVSSENHAWSNGGLLNYRSDSPFVYCPGGATFIRKTAWQRYPWNENLYWNEHEDVELSRRVQRRGEVVSLADVVLTTEEDRWVAQNPWLGFNDQVDVQLGPPVGRHRAEYITQPPLSAPGDARATENAECSHPGHIQEVTSNE